MIKYNFHTHSEYCDGKDDIEKYVIKAIEKEFYAIGFSPHSPLPFENPWSISNNNLEKYIHRAAELKEKYKNKIKIFTGIEFDYIPGYSDDFKNISGNGSLDYIIGSVHLVKKNGREETWFIDGKEESFFDGINKHFNGNAKKAVESFYQQTIEMIKTQKFDIIGHVDKVKMHNKERAFSTNGQWYKSLTESVLKEIKKHNIIVELNTRGVYTGKSSEYFPSEEILQKCLKMDIPVMINTDAHSPEQLDMHYHEALQVLKKTGFKKINTPFFDVDI